MGHVVVWCCLTCLIALTEHNLGGEFEGLSRTDVAFEQQTLWRIRGMMALAVKSGCCIDYGLLCLRIPGVMKAVDLKWCLNVIVKEVVDVLKRRGIKEMKKKRRRRRKGRGRCVWPL